LEEAVKLFEQGLKVFQAAGATAYIEGAQKNLATARTELKAKRTSKPE
jgi:hypothetical protein